MIREELSDCFTVCVVLNIGPDIQIMMQKMQRWAERLEEAKSEGNL